MLKITRYTILLLLASLLLAACRQQADTAASAAITVQLELTPAAPVVGEGELAVTVRDAEGALITDAQVAVRGDMTHAGMVPLLAVATLGDDGRYYTPFAWTMGGDWIVTVTVTLPDGVKVEETFTYNVGGTMSDMGDAQMPMNMGEMTPEATAEQ